jgi:hypothetical protein
MFTTDDSLGLFPEKHYDQGAPMVHINTNFVHLVHHEAPPGGLHDHSERVLEVPCALCIVDPELWWSHWVCAASFRSAYSVPYQSPLPCLCVQVGAARGVHIGLAGNPNVMLHPIVLPESRPSCLLVHRPQGDLHLPARIFGILEGAGRISVVGSTSYLQLRRICSHDYSVVSMDLSAPGPQLRVTCLHCLCCCCHLALENVQFCCAHCRRTISKPSSLGT